jgi:tetratricopeptide (TPR) repeat protein
LGARYNAGVCRLHLREFKEALADFEYVLSAVPYFPRAVFNKAEALFALKRKEEALVQFALAVDLYEPFGQELLDGKAHIEKIRDPEIGARLTQKISRERR